jgi:acetyl-CoA carboxylase carboxyltransferase component
MVPLVKCMQKKIANIYDMALKMGAPVIGLIDCAGLRLQEATDALEAFGTLYFKQAMASGVIPQITAIFGVCGGGLAVIPGLTDFTFMESEEGRLFINSPNALEGNNVSACDTATASYQSKTAGLVDRTGKEEELLYQIRSLVCMIPMNNMDGLLYYSCTDDLNRTCTNIDDFAEDTVLALEMVSDNHIFFETKKEYAPDMVTGFIRLNGLTIGAVANRSKIYHQETGETSELHPVLSAEGCKKAADLVNFCDAFAIPVLTLTNVTGFASTIESEKDMAAAVAKLTYAFASATVPKVNLITGKAYGSAYVAMNSKSLGADIVYAWPSAEIGMMDPETAVKIMYEDADSDLLKKKAEEYKMLQSNPVSAARRGYVDAIIAPQDTRKYLIGAYEMLFTKKESRPKKKHGLV